MGCRECSYRNGEFVETDISKIEKGLASGYEPGWAFFHTYYNKAVV